MVKPKSADNYCMSGSLVSRHLLLSTLTFLPMNPLSSGFIGCCWLDMKFRIGFAASVMSSLHRIWKDKRLPLPTKLCVFQALFSVYYYRRYWQSNLLFVVKCVTHISNLRKIGQKLRSLSSHIGNRIYSQ